MQAFYFDICFGDEVVETREAVHFVDSDAAAARAASCLREIAAAFMRNGEQVRITAIRVRDARFQPILKINLRDGIVSPTATH